MVSPARLEAKLRTRIAEAAERPENRLFAAGSDARNWPPALPAGDLSNAPLAWGRLGAVPFFLDRSVDID